jgi:hypothetical protein
LLSRFDGAFLLLFYSIMLRAVLGLFPYSGKDLLCFIPFGNVK